MGIGHETYVTTPGSHENIYINMRPFGLGKTATVYPATGGQQSAASRMGVREGADRSEAPHACDRRLAEVEKFRKQIIESGVTLQ